MGRARVSSPGGEATAVRVLGDCSALQRAAGGGRWLTGVASGSRGATGDPRDVGWELLCGEVKKKKNDKLTETNHYAPAKVNTTPSGWASKAAQCPHAPSPSAL